MHHRFSRFVSFGLICILMLALVAVAGAQDDGSTITTGISMVGGDLLTIDPALSETSSQIDVVNQIFIGITIQNVVTGETGLGIADSWEVSDDGRTFTFVLNENIPWVRYNAETDAVEQVMDEEGNPRMVNAHDVVFGWQRTLAGETASPYSYILAAYVENGTEFNAGEVDAEELGITAVDDFTIEVQVPEQVAGAPFLPAIFGLWMARPQPQFAIDEFGDEWTEPENIVTNGPYALKEWAHGESITIVANPFWPGNETIPQPQVQEVNFRFLDPQAQFAEYLAGTMDAIQVPVEEIDRIRADATLSQEYVTGANPCTYYIGFDNTEAPTDNVHLRRALSMAIDRQSLVENVTRRGETPAQWFTYPSLTAAPTLETNPDLGVMFNVELAQEELALALEQLGLASPEELVLSAAYNESSNHGAIMQAIQQMWTDNLGVTVELSGMDPTTYFESLSQDAPSVYRAGWCQDYSDTNNFLYDVFYSASSQNDTGFVNAEFDALVDEARTTADTDARRELYAQAENILVNEVAAIAPTHWYTLNLLVKPGVERAPSTTGNEAYYLWSVSE